MIVFTLAAFRGLSEPCQAEVGGHRGINAFFHSIIDGNACLYRQQIAQKRSKMSKRKCQYERNKVYMQVDLESHFIKSESLVFTTKPTTIHNATRILLCCQGRSQAKREQMERW